jgi:hypothetical protein
MKGRAEHGIGRVTKAMLSQLDRDLSRIMDALTAEGGMFATVPFQRAG